MELMKSPRCGMPDMESEADMMRKKRYALGSRWRSTDLTWKLINRTNDLRDTDVDRIMTRALKVWSDVSSLTFQEVTSGSADIEIFFTRGLHEDGVDGAFDGPGGVLAHAYFPSTGDAHFDEDEMYTDGMRSGINLFQVAAHEFGHSLGLGHSQVESALMYPYYRGYQSDFMLDQDDIDGIQAQYGEDNATPDENATPTTPVDNCMTQLSWVAGTADGNFYFANETHLFRRQNGRLVTAGYPRRIEDEFPGLPTDLDAAVFLNPYTYFFKGDQYWRFQNQQMVNGFPQGISDWGVDLPSELDSAFVFGSNGGLFFTKGNEYYGTRRNPDFSNGYEVPSEYNYPRSLSVLMNLPSTGVDAAIQSYFFAGPNTYLVVYDGNTRTYRVADGYPKNTATFWLGCDPNELNLDPNEGPGGDAPVMVPSMVAVLFSAFSALYYAF